MGAEKILVIDDHVAAAQWERDLYRLGVPPDMEVDFSSVDDAPDALENLVASDKTGMVVIPDVETLVRVCDATDLVRRVNLGGLHERAGRRRRLSYVFLSDWESESLKSLASKGVEVTARDVPSAKAIPLSEIL